MINKLNKVKAIIIMLLVSAMMFTAGTLLSLKNSPVSADEPAVTSTFTMSETVQARIATPSGLRFIVNFDEATKAKIEEAGKLSFIIAPSDKFVDGTDYLSEGFQKVVVDIDVTNSLEKLVADGNGGYYATAILYNIKEANWNKNFSAIAYYTDATSNEVVFADGNLPSASIDSLVNKAFFENSNSETRARIYTYFNYGGYDANTFEFTMNGETQSYTVEPHPIRVKASQFDFISTIDYNGNDAAYYYILTEDVELSFIDGTNYIYENDFGGILNGNGHTIKYKVYSTIPFRGLYKRISGKIFNLTVDTTDLTLAYGENASFAQYVSGEIENVVFLYHLKTNSYENVYETSPSSGIVYEADGTAQFNNIVIYDESQGIHAYFLVRGGAGPKISNLAYVGPNTALGVPGYGGSYQFSWRKLPFAVNEKHIEVENFHVYQNIKAALAGDGKSIEDFEYEVMPHGSVEDVKWHVFSETKFEEVLVSDPEFMPIALGYFHEGDNHGYRITMGDVVVYEQSSIYEKEINNAEEFVEAMKSGAFTNFNIKSDIVVTSAYLDPKNGVALNNGYLFNNDLAGNIIGNGHTITFNVNARDVYANGKFVNGIFKSISGSIIDTHIDIQVGSIYWAGNYSILTKSLTGSIEDSIITYDNGTEYANYGYASLIEGMTAKAVIKNVLVVANNGYTAGSPFVRNAEKTSTISNVVIVSNKLADNKNNYITIVLPTTKCNITNFYAFTSVSSDLKGTGYMLTARKYNKDDAPANVKNLDEVTALFGTSRNKAIKDVVGFDIEASIAVVTKGVYDADKTLIGSEVVYYNTYDFLKYKASDVVFELAETLALDEDSRPSAIEFSVKTKAGDAINNRQVTWSSSDENVVTINYLGVITVVGAGQATITGTFYGISKTCVVTVSEFDTSNVTLTLDKNELVLDQEDYNAQLVATVLKGEVEYDPYVFTWASDNSDVVTVDQTGLVTVVGVGEANVSITFYGVTATCKVIVNEFDTTTVDFAIDTNAINVDEEYTNQQIIATITKDGEEYVSKQPIVWSSSNEKVATVDQTGLVTFLTEGQTIITAKFYNAERTCTVNVAKFDTSKVVVTILQSELKLNERSEDVLLAASIANDNKAYTPKNPIVWASTNTSVVTVDQNGLVSVVGMGEAEITATFYDKVTSITVTVAEDKKDIATAAELIADLTADITGSINLTNDIVITDAYINSNGGASVSGGNLFATQKGTLYGNGHSITISVDTTDQTYFSGIFNTISGTIKDVTFVLNVKTPLLGSSSRGTAVLAKTLNGTLDNCVITYSNKCSSGGEGYGYVSLIGSLGASAEIKNTVIYANDVYVAGGWIACYAADTAKITNVAIINKDLADTTKYHIGYVLPNVNTTEVEGSDPIISKCAIDGLYVFDSVENAIAGTGAYSLNAEKYAAATATQIASPDEAIAALFDSNVTKKLSEILTLAENAEVVAINAPITLLNGPASMNALFIKSTQSLGLSISKSSIDLVKTSDPVQLSATVTLNSIELNETGFEWSSDNEAIVTVVDGLVTVVGIGTANVTVTYFGLTQTCVVNVIDFDGTGVELSLNETEVSIIETEKTYQLTASFTRNGEPIEAKDFFWASDDESIVTVDENGLVTFVGVGTANVSVAIYGYIATCEITVDEYLIDIGTAAELIAAFNNDAYGKYRLTADIVLTDNVLDPDNGTFARNANVFPDFAGVLDGDGHILTINTDTTGQAYFNGVFRFVYGTIRNTNFVVNIRAPHNGERYRGALIYRLYGKFENCIVNITTVNAEQYGYWSTFGLLGDNAEVKNVIINFRNIYMAGGLIAETVEPTSKVTNVAILSHQLGWADMYLGMALPLTQKCDINGLYFYETNGSSIDAAFNGVAKYVLDKAKYTAKDAPFNITWLQSDCDESNIDVLYSRNAEKSLESFLELPEGATLVADKAPVIKYSGEATLDIVRVQLAEQAPEGETPEVVE